MIRGAIFDIDGVLEYQGKVYPGAVELLQTLRGRGVQIRFLTNSTLKSRASAAERLRRAGFQVETEEMFTASYCTAAYLREHDLRPCWVLLEREGLDEFAGIDQDEEHPAYIVMGDNRSRFNFDTLNKAFRLIQGGAQLIGMISELVDSSLGQLELNVGSWVRMLETASGRPAVYIGKPHPYAMSLTLASMGLPREQVIVVGDRVGSDVAGARAAGLRSALVRTGEFRPADLEGPLQPDWIFDSITDVLVVFDREG